MLNINNKKLRNEANKLRRNVAGGRVSLIVEWFAHECVIKVFKPTSLKQIPFTFFLLSTHSSSSKTSKRKQKLFLSSTGCRLIFICCRLCAEQNSRRIRKKVRRNFLFLARTRVELSHVPHFSALGFPRTSFENIFQGWKVG